MKRVCLLLLIFTAAFLFSGCSKNKKPDSMTESVYELSIEALEAADDYLDKKITSSQASDIIGRVYDDLQLIKGQETKDTLASSNILLLKYSVYDGDDDATILEKRNSLAKILEMKERK